MKELVKDVVSPLKYGLVLCVAALVVYGTTTINPVQGLQTGKNLVQYFVPGLGWFVDANTVTLVTKDKLQSGTCQFLNSTNGTKGYTYALGSACLALGVYTPGMRFWLKTDTPCIADCTLNVDNIGMRNIKQADGTTDPKGLFDFTQGVPIWYDGTVFRIEWQH